MIRTFLSLSFLSSLLFYTHTHTHTHTHTIHNCRYTSAERFLQEQQQEESQSSHHIKSFQIHPRNYNLTPHPKDMLIPQQLLCLKVCREAVLDANLRKGSRAAVLVAMRTEAETYELYTKQAKQGTAVSYLGYIETRSRQECLLCSISTVHPFPSRTERTL